MNKKGLTFSELIVTTFVVVTAVVSALLLFTNALTASQYSRDVTVATSRVDGLFEEMQSRPSLANITGTDWTDWLSSQDLEGLPGESLNVVYSNAVAVPLEVTAQLSWVRKERAYTESFVTRMTK